MKKSILFLTLLMVGLLMYSALPAVAAEFRVVNTTALGGAKELSTEELVKVSKLGVAENPRVFPALSTFNYTLEKGALMLSGSIEEKENMELISLPDPDAAGKMDLAVVKPDGTVVKIDDEVVIDYKARTIRTFSPVMVGEGDVVLAFARDIKEVYLGGAPGVAAAPMEYQPPGLTTEVMLLHDQGGEGAGVKSGGGKGTEP